MFLRVKPSLLARSLPNTSRTVLYQATGQRSPISTVSDVIKEDHREIRRCYQEVVNSSDHDHQERYGNQFIWTLARHSVAEELVVYPAFEKHMGDKGRAMAEKDREEHHQVKELLKQFGKLKPRDADYVPTLQQLWGVLAQHIEEEEKIDLHALDTKLRSSDGASEAIAKSFERTKMFIPTRSHPIAGEHPPFETAMGLLTAPIDRLADMFRKFPTDR